ncbi:hypothetical protein Pa4123_62170 [Phytohabitans aurantiacus]|uniref:Uncharacterized protein n=1 Tax=Phytohabitans aurantiacus TaxID=3016789 RepID=A0ABQ5R325_9ACTN|nr:hypothetical protein Pa4123_62170 [Phytohabitans aurantiacus]
MPAIHEPIAYTAMLFGMSQRFGPASGGREGSCALGKYDGPQPLAERAVVLG